VGATALVNGRIITPLRIVDNGVVISRDDMIVDVGPAGQVIVPADAQVIDVEGAYISPGFVDLHVHGFWGGDVMSGSLDDLEKMCRGLAKCGVTSFLPTTLSGDVDRLNDAIRCVQQAQSYIEDGARIRGVHLEGPYLNPEQRGAQNLKHIVEPDPADYVPLFNEYSCIKRVSAAPEIPGGLRLGRELRRRGIVASIAHSNATYTQVLEAIENGYTHVTHIFSGMSGMQRVSAYRVAGVVESTMLLDELTTEIIADGHHLPPSLIKLVLKSKGLDRVCLVTDAMSAAGLGPGEYNLGGLKVVVEDAVPGVFEVPMRDGNYVAKLPDRSAFASSVATMNQMLKNMIELVGLQVNEAVQLATINPARMQSLDHEIGRVARNMKADLTVFDEDINILLTMVNGRVVYRRRLDCMQRDEGMAPLCPGWEDSYK
jgi:N-acetylglucosamine-6-phosphate deacetylase